MTFQKLLPVLDDLERAIRSARLEGAAPSHTQGLEMIYNQLFKLLSQEGCAGSRRQVSPSIPIFTMRLPRLKTKLTRYRGSGDRKSGMSGGGTDRGIYIQGPDFKTSMVKVYK